MKSVILTLVSILFFAATVRLMAADDIDIDTTSINGSATPVVSSDAQNSVSTSSLAVTPTAGTPSINPTNSKNATEEPTVDQSSTPTPMTVQGILKMKDVYKAGLVYYKKQDFANAIRYLKQSLEIHDPYTPKFYYAEANAMLGVIYEFNIIDKKLAYEYYQEALRIDPSTASAKKHIKEVTDNTDAE